MTNIQKLAKYIAQLEYQEDIIEVLPIFLEEIFIDRESQIFEKGEVIIGDITFTI